MRHTVAWADSRVRDNAPGNHRTARYRRCPRRAGRQDRAEPTDGAGAGAAGTCDLSGVVRRLRAGEGQGRRRDILPLHTPAHLRRPAHPLRRFRHRPRAGGVGGEGAIERLHTCGWRNPEAIGVSLLGWQCPLVLRQRRAEQRRDMGNQHLRADHRPRAGQQCSENSSQRQHNHFCTRDCRETSDGRYCYGIQSVMLWTAAWQWKLVWPSAPSPAGGPLPSYSSALTARCSIPSQAPPLMD